MVNYAVLVVLGALLALNTPIDRTVVIAAGAVAAIAGVFGLVSCLFDYMRPNRQ